MLLPLRWMFYQGTVTPPVTPPPVVSDGTFIWNWLFGRKKRLKGIPDEVVEAAEEVRESVAEQDDAALLQALDRLETALAEAIAHNRSLVERVAYAQLRAAIDAEQARLRDLEIRRLEAHLAERAAWRMMVDAEAQELLQLLQILD